MKLAIIGGGPAGLMAAQAAGGGVVFEHMPTVARKFLIAGRGGLNLTHSEDFETFLTRYRPDLSRWLREFGPAEVRRWCEDLGFETFVGSSKRVFPRTMKAAPLLRAWLQRLGVEVRTRHHWQGWDEQGRLLFEGHEPVQAETTILALGGASWPRLGSRGDWTEHLTRRGIEITPWAAANVGYEVAWSDHFRERFAGTPVKSVALSFEGKRQQGEFVVTRHGVEGSLVYPFAPLVRDQLPCTVELDLVPGVPLEKLERELAKPRGSKSMAKHLHQRAGIDGVKAGLVREFCPEITASALKAVPLRLERPRPLAEAISVAGGVKLSEVDEHLMLRKLPGVFVAGEMLDWEAPTGGYLLTACLALGRAAGLGSQMKRRPTTVD